MTPFVRLVLSLFLVGVIVTPVSAQSGSFGNAVLIDGDALIIGEPNNSFRPGTVYLYHRQGGSWVESDQLTAPGSDTPVLHIARKASALESQ